MADRLAIDPHEIAFRAKMPVGIDFHLHAAIAEDPLGDDGDHIHAVDLAGDDERRGLVVGIGRSGADRGDEGLTIGQHVALPGIALVIAIQERYDLAAALDPVLQDRQRVQTHQLATLIGVSVTGAGSAIGDVAHDRTGIAADLLAGRFTFGRVAGDLLSHVPRLPIPCPWRPRPSELPRAPARAWRAFGKPARRLHP